jgi:DNA-binding response OmpR family regulator
MMGGGYILMVEDEPIVQENNRKILSRRGYNVKQAFTLAEAREIIATEPPRAIILDINLPDGSGLEFLRELRKTPKSPLRNTPVLFLTALGTSEDIVKGLESGGDDYLPKPYDLSVFLVRLAALLRRAAFIPESLELGPIRIDLAANKAYLNGDDMGLPLKEISLLQQFVRNPGQSLSSEYLYEKAWGQKMAGSDGNTLRVAISKLRDKLKESSFNLQNSRGGMYMLSEK